MLPGGSQEKALKFLPRDSSLSLLTGGRALLSPVFLSCTLSALQNAGQSKESKSTWRDVWALVWSWDYCNIPNALRRTTVRPSQTKEQQKACALFLKTLLGYPSLISHLRLLSSIHLFLMCSTTGEAVHQTLQMNEWMNDRQTDKALSPLSGNQVPPGGFYNPSVQQSVTISHF